MSGLTSSEGKPAPQKASTADIPKLSPLAPPVLAHVSQVAEQGISDLPHLSPAG